MNAEPFLLSIVVAAYNEEQSLRLLIPALRAALGSQVFAYEVILVDDGSSDQTGAVAKEYAAGDSSIRYIRFSRNFGQQAAITAGLDAARGNAVVVMDADLQDPPELLPEMVRLHLQGYEVVSARRDRRDGESTVKILTAKMFYGLMRRFVDKRMQPEVGDFRLYGPRALAALRAMREQHRFLRGMAAWTGFKEVILPFARPARAVGETKYGFWKMLRFAWTGISSFSALPLRASLLLGLATAGMGFLYLGYTVYAALVLHTTVQGWASLIAVQVIFSGVTLVALGLLGEYVARIYEESKGRPLYLVEETVNIEESKTPARKPSESRVSHSG
ncbi:MAG TPA: glycosyltransferase family 2 protein [Bryobacteraceae bacterium]|nr:glycosyltransferase family 2 protein [Bryobacteraceae bacterium]